MEGADAYMGGMRRRAGMSGMGVWCVVGFRSYGVLCDSSSSRRARRVKILACSLRANLGSCRNVEDLVGRPTAAVTFDAGACGGDL